jgi:hypothetical protein
MDLIIRVLCFVCQDFKHFVQLFSMLKSFVDQSIDVLDILKNSSNITGKK